MSPPAKKRRFGEEMNRVRGGDRAGFIGVREDARRKIPDGDGTRADG